MSLQMTFNRIHQFSCAHRLHSNEMSEGKNVEIYDKCNNLNGHGHDYKLEVSIRGVPDTETGMIMPFGEFDKGVREVISVIDYKHLDKEVEFFKHNLSSGEIIIQYLWQELDKQFPGNKLYHLKLWETNNNYFEYDRG